MIKPTLMNCSDLVTQILLEGAQDVLGADKLRQVISELAPDQGTPVEQQNSEAIPPLADVGPLLQMLEGIYGVPGGRGLALRIGRAAFKYGLKEFGERTGFYTAEFRLLPVPRRIRMGLDVLAQIIGGECDDTITITEHGTYWLWSSDNCPLCRAHQSADPSCHVFVGLLQEFTTWAGGGRFYPVTETICRANGGAACEYRIEKKPLD